MSDRQPHVVVVDDERLLHGVLDRLLSRHGLRVTSCTSALQAIDALKADPADLVVTDFQMPDMDGLALLAHVREHYPETDTIMITGHASVQHAVRAMGTGAVDYLPKPFSTQVLLERVQAHLERRQAGPRGAAALAENPARPAPAKRRAKKTRTEFVGEHPSVRQLKGLLPRFAQSKAPVFVHGESGVGKEVLSRLIHEQSDRDGGPFVAINCANLPRELVESHLFGHRKGSFTGATDNMTGAFEQADGGTLLLDEITEVSLDVQAKLLRVLQEQEIQPVGAEKPKQINVRVIATSNRDLAEAMDAGTFRRDLYHRLAVFPLYVPPLRERLSDVPTLAQRFIDKYCALYGLPKKTLSPALLMHFERYSWPGNVRQLENMVHRGVVLAAERTVVELDDVANTFLADARPLTSGDGVASGDGMAQRHPLVTALPTTLPVVSVAEPAGVPVLASAPAAPALVAEAPAYEAAAYDGYAYGAPADAAPEAAVRPLIDNRVTIEEVERHMILGALDRTGGNQREAAEHLGICARTIRNKLKRYREQGLVA